MSTSSIFTKTCVSALLALAVALPLSNAFAQNDRPMGPPPEAFTACESMAEGDVCSVTTPHGDTLEGSCAMPQQGEQSSLVCAMEGGRPPARQ